MDDKEKNQEIVNSPEEVKEGMIPETEGETSELTTLEEKIETSETEEVSKDSGIMEENLKEGETALDDARRVKVVSPGMLVAKRFFRNKLALIGMFILIVLFMFCFVGSWVYKYDEDDIFQTYKEMYFNYANVDYRETYDYYMFEQDPSADITMLAYLNENILTKMIPENLDTLALKDKSGQDYSLNKLKDGIYKLIRHDKDVSITLAKKRKVGIFDNTGITLEDWFTPSTALRNQLEAASGKDTVNYGGNSYYFDGTKRGDIVCTYGTPSVVSKKDSVDDAFVTEAQAHYTDETVTYDAVTYSIFKDGDTYLIYLPVDVDYLISSKMVLNCYEAGTLFTDAFIAKALNVVGTNGTAIIDGTTYKTSTVDGEIYLDRMVGAEQQHYAIVTNFVARRYNGEDTLTVEYKKQAEVVINYMLANNLYEYMANIQSEKMVEDPESGELVPAKDEHGDPIYDEEEFEVTRTQRNFVFRNIQAKYVADIYAAPSKDHILGLDYNAMDVLARIMYGGRISLVIGFIVVFIEIILGMILGGIAGYFGGVVDNIIMRIVDIFYCLPSLPIMIILGATFDSIGMPNLERIIWMMVLLGLLGWPGIARLVRGQILSLREQEFMIAAEASGLSNRRRIFKHLIPNVMPQLIVQATMGLGGVIITESTLSFLGLGVKYPMATWGAIINSVSTINDMIKYTYIWIPVGALICLAVIAFNFVGDGLRDAFDPKMKR